MSSFLEAIPFDTISLAIGAIYSLFKSIKFIQEGERGVKLRFGKAVCKNGVPKIYDPGFTLLIPFVDTLQRHHVRQQTIPFNGQRVMLKNGMTFEISAFVRFRITNVYKALFEIDNVDGSVEDVSMGALRDKLSALTHEELVDTENVSKSVLFLLRQIAEQWGVEILDFRLTNCAPSAETINLVNIPAKLTMLETVAKKLGKNLESIDAGLLSVLIGAPLVASPPVHTLAPQRGQVEREQGGRLLSIVGSDTDGN